MGSNRGAKAPPPWVGYAVMEAQKEQQELFANLLGIVGDNRSSLPTARLTGFVGMKGIRSTGELVIVGRSVNGWENPGWYPEEIYEQEVRLEITRRLFEESGGDGSHCPMSWVADAWYRPQGWNAKRSAFWRVIRYVIGRLRIANVDGEIWASHLAWTNLYKISPAYRGNPSSRLCHIQLELCKELLNLELKEFKPQRLLLLTGIGWARPFLDSWALRVSDSPNVCLTTTAPAKFVDAIGSLPLPRSDKLAKLVIARHPQGKPAMPFVEEVVRAFLS